LLPLLLLPLLHGFCSLLLQPLLMLDLLVRLELICVDHWLPAASSCTKARLKLQRILALCHCLLPQHGCHPPAGGGRQAGQGILLPAAWHLVDVDADLHDLHKHCLQGNMSNSTTCL
jgi:hypothetical protein